MIKMTKMIQFSDVEYLMRKYKIGFDHATKLLNEPFVQDLQHRVDNVTELNQQLIKKNLNLKERCQALLGALYLAKHKFNNDKAKHRRKYRKYRNIVNDLEKYLEDKLKNSYGHIDGKLTTGEYIEFQLVLNRLQELRKGISND